MKRPSRRALASLAARARAAAAALLILLPGGAVTAFAQSRGPAPSTPPDDRRAAPRALRIGIISYWKVPGPWPAATPQGAPASCGPLASTPWAEVPADSLVLINPNSGVLQRVNDKAQPKKQYAEPRRPVDDVRSWVNLARCLRDRGVVVLGYVPTGYFDREPCEKDKASGWFKCQTEADIRSQVKTYYDLIPELDGIFFDETSRKGGINTPYGQEYAFLRSMNRMGRISVFNVGSPSEEAVGAAQACEHLVLYEAEPQGYDTGEAEITRWTSEARKNGVIVWHLLHSVGRGDSHGKAVKKMGEYVGEMAERCADYGYVTDLKVDEAWDAPPRYWKEEREAFSNLKPNAKCPGAKKQ